MSLFTVNGGIPLSGDVTVSGSKNASLPILFSTIITRGISVLRRVPDIGDVRCAIGILSSYGATVRREGDTLTVDTRDLHYTEPSALSSTLRASTYLIGASLARFSRFRLSSFGGCRFSPRPIDLHLYAARMLGAELSGGVLTTDGLLGGVIDLPTVSVGATVNSLIMASVAHGSTVIRGFAREPHVLALAEFLISAGASIAFTDDEILVEGRELHGGDVTVIGDMIEAGTYLSAALITDGHVTVRGVAPAELSAYLDAISDMGASVALGADSVAVSRGSAHRPSRVFAAPYPAFPTDLQPIMASTMAALSGGEIYDNVFPSRFGYLGALSSFGVAYSSLTCGARIEPSQLHNGVADAPDLRGGMACILSALASRGESRITSADIILRGYDSPADKLSSLGARITLSANK